LHIVVKKNQFTSAKTREIIVQFFTYRRIHFTGEMLRYSG